MTRNQNKRARARTMADLTDLVPIDLAAAHSLTFDGAKLFPSLIIDWRRELDPTRSELKKMRLPRRSRGTFTCLTHDGAASDVLSLDPQRGVAVSSAR